MASCATGSLRRCEIECCLLQRLPTIIIISILILSIIMKRNLIETEGTVKVRRSSSSVFTFSAAAGFLMRRIFSPVLLLLEIELSALPQLFHPPPQLPLSSALLLLVTIVTSILNMFVLSDPAAAD